MTDTKYPGTTKSAIRRVQYHPLARPEGAVGLPFDERGWMECEGLE